MPQISNGMDSCEVRNFEGVEVVHRDIPWEEEGQKRKLVHHRTAVDDIQVVAQVVHACLEGDRSDHYVHTDQDVEYEAFGDNVEEGDRGSDHEVLLRNTAVEVVGMVPKTVEGLVVLHASHAVVDRELCSLGDKKVDSSHACMSFAEKDGSYETVLQPYSSGTVMVLLEISSTVVPFSQALTIPFLLASLSAKYCHFHHDFPPLSDRRNFPLYFALVLSFRLMQP